MYISCIYPMTENLRFSAQNGELGLELNGWAAVRVNKNYKNKWHNFR